MECCNKQKQMHSKNKESYIDCRSWVGRISKSRNGIMHIIPLRKINQTVLNKKKSKNDTAGIHFFFIRT